MSEQRGRTPAEIVRKRCECGDLSDPVQQADKRWYCWACSLLTDARPRLYVLQVEAELAAALDREQARQQQTCGTCDCWRASQTRPDVGLCTSFAYHDYDVDTDRTHSCAAWTAKENER